MQRRLLSRFVLNSEHEHHSGLGLDAYVTATSPIRKYFDLVTQRQIRAVLGLEEPYSMKEIDNIIQMLAQPMSCVSKLQFNRHRYWLLKPEDLIQITIQHVDARKNVLSVFMS